MVEAKEIGVTVHASTGMTTAWHVAFTLEGERWFFGFSSAQQARPAHGSGVSSPSFLGAEAREPASLRDSEASSPAAAADGESHPLAQRREASPVLPAG